MVLYLHALKYLSLSVDVDILLLLVWPARPTPPLLFYYADVYGRGGINKPQHSKIGEGEWV